mgnify:CR=1 FL=1
MKKLKKLLADCRQSPEKIDDLIKTHCDALDAEALIEIIEMSDQPLLFNVENREGAPEDFLRPVAVQFLEYWTGIQLEHDICNMPYGDYVRFVDYWLQAHGEEDMSEDEMAVADQMQCDLELPHVCAREIKRDRHAG